MAQQPLLSHGELPELLRFADGTPIADSAAWPRRRAELLGQFLDLEYGPLPPAPQSTRGELLFSHTLAQLDNARQSQFRFATGPDRSFQFVAELLVPTGAGPFPAIIRGDRCWGDLPQEIALNVIRRGYALLQFNRCEVAPDVAADGRTTGLYRAYPEGDYGAMSAWAWGYHRCVDFLLALPNIRHDQIAVTGHSRGGKAALLAGATDDRIAVTNANNSGCGGAGLFKRQGPDCETLGRIVRVFPYWFSPKFQQFSGREADLAFDQHAVLAAVAPRGLLCTEAMGDLWANPAGTWQSFIEARKAYQFLGVPDRIGIRFRQGGHAHGETDWRELLDFLEWQFKGIVPAKRFDIPMDQETHQ
jgi:hypothetical protein